MSAFRRFVSLALPCALALACRSEREAGTRAGATSAPSAALEPPSLDVLTAPSVESAVRKAGQGFQARNTRVSLRFEVLSPAQIRARLRGAPKADVVVIEGELSDGPGVVAGSARKIGESRLVLVRSRRADEIQQPAEMPKASFPHFVLADPADNPSGAAAKAWLGATKVGSASLLELLEPRLLPKPDARAAFAELERRGRTMGVMLQIDLAAAKTIKPFFELPVAPIPFTAAVVPGPEREQAAEFVALLAAQGLTPPADAAP